MDVVDGALVVAWGESVGTVLVVGGGALVAVPGRRVVIVAAESPQPMATRPSAVASRRCTGGLTVMPMLLAYRIWQEWREVNSRRFAETAFWLATVAV